MIYEKTDFIKNYQNALKYNDLQGLHDLFVGRIGALVANHKQDVVATLASAGIKVSPDISEDELCEKVVSLLGTGNKNVTKAIASLITTKEMHDPHFAADGDEGGAGGSAGGSGGKGKFNSDQITSLVSSVTSGLGAVMNFGSGIASSVKSGKDAKAAAAAAKNQPVYQPQPTATPTGMSTGAKIGIGLGVFLGLSFIGFLAWKKFGSAGSTTPAAPAAASGAPAA